MDRCPVCGGVRVGHNVGTGAIDAPLPFCPNCARNNRFDTKRSTGPIYVTVFAGLLALYLPILAILSRFKLLSPELPQNAITIHLCLAMLGGALFAVLRGGVQWRIREHLSSSRTRLQTLEEPSDPFWNVTWLDTRTGERLPGHVVPMRFAQRRPEERGLDFDSWLASAGLKVDPEFLQDLDMLKKSIDRLSRWDERIRFFCPILGILAGIAGLTALLAALLLG